jgi:hypothetical protein
MSRRIVQSVIVMGLFFGSLSAATDPFVGKWKLDQSKSKMAGEQAKIEDLGGNKFTMTFGEISDTIVADGTDQPVHFGRTEAITQDGPSTWKIVEKKDGRTLQTSTWTLSPDGKTIKVEGTGTRADGSTSTAQFTLKRVAGASGFTGKWESTSASFGSPAEFDIQPYESDGLSFVTPSESDTLNMKFDGKDYPETGPNVAPGSASSGHRVNEHTLDVTDKVKGDVIDTTRFAVSADGKTLTLTVHEKGQSKPLVFVYERE